MSRHLLSASSAAVILALTSACGPRSDQSASTASDSSAKSPPRGTPPAWLTSRIATEADLAKASPAFHDFRLTNGVAQSGITFVHRIVDDAGKNYKAVHYDHGTGVAAA